MGIHKITPFLWFETEAEEAASYYTSIFPNSRISHVARFTKEGEEAHGEPEGAVMSVQFELAGQKFVALNGRRASGFTEAISFHIGCESQDEIDHYWERLSDGGLEQACGWLKDKFGVSWQVVPSALIDMLSDPDPEKAGRVTQAMLQMTKIDIAELERARDGGI